MKLIDTYGERRDLQLEEARATPKRHCNPASLPPLRVQEDDSPSIFVVDSSEDSVGGSLEFEGIGYDSRPSTMEVMHARDKTVCESRTEASSVTSGCGLQLLRARIIYISVLMHSFIDMAGVVM